MMWKEFLERLSDIEGVYHFYDNEEHHVDSIEKDYLWFSNVDDFNDPFEILIQPEDIDLSKFSDIELANFCRCNPLIRFNDMTDGGSFIPANETSEATKKVVSAYRSGFVKCINESIYNQVMNMRQDKYLCLSHDIKINPVQNRLMWSHYADGMRGFVIEFDFDGLLESLEKMNASYAGFINVMYHNSDIEQYIKDVTSEGGGINQRHIASQKHEDWRYESELRLIGGENIMRYDQSCIKRIIIGSKMPLNIQNRLILVLEKKGLKDKLYISEIKRKDFSISLKKY